jgi:hypothetical protein
MKRPEIDRKEDSRTNMMSYVILETTLYPRYTFPQKYLLMMHVQHGGFDIILSPIPVKTLNNITKREGCDEQLMPP